MSALTAVLEFFDGLLGSAAYFPILLLGVGVFFTLYLGFPQLRFFATLGRYCLAASRNQKIPAIPAIFKRCPRHYRVP